MNSTPTTHDVIIMGGGLAGLTLALQLRQRLPMLDVRVLERRSHPVPEACHKVGESTVEIGAHYFADVLGLKQHLMDTQLKKFGFRFFFSEGRTDFDQVTELGASRPLPVGSWQIDRGIFENFLGQEVQRRGIHFSDNALIRELDLAPDDQPDALHTVRWQEGQQPLQTAQARWVIDACGRAGLIKKKLGLARENAHPAHAVWFRISEHIVPDGWSQDPAWQARCMSPTRWLSTNHLVGAGYWVWLIPLSSGSHSVGIVADPRYHSLDSMNTFERAMDWFKTYQPRLFADLDGKRDKLQDFAFFKRFSYDCAQIFSDKRWALAGESGRFLDPFYSPGSDFIGIGNTYITELVARDHARQPLGAHVRVYEQVFKSFYDNTLALYVDQYGLFGDPEVLPIKVFWDYTYYWGVLAKLFYHQGLTDLVALSHLRDRMAGMQPLNLAVQTFVREMSTHSRKRNLPIMLDQASLPWFVELNRSLVDPHTPEEFMQRLQESATRLRQLATEILDRAAADYPQLDGSPLQQAIEAAGGLVRLPEKLLFPALGETQDEALAV
ncbi:MAG: NAD(P)/FAD-dependent oxidoreductase [Rubrivivax sp.]|nr:NAD(P)/FAD-dependent oxidoreductase [Rubrivivax sp.]